METATEADCACSRALVVRKHDATDESQLTLKLHEVVIVLERDESGWWGGHKEGKRKTGWFPGTCVRLEKESAHSAGKSEPDKALEERLHDMQRRSEEDQQRINELQGSVAKLEAQVSDLESKLSAEEKHKSDLQEELAELKREAKPKVKCDTELPTGSVRQICEVLEVRARERQDFGMSPMRLGGREVKGTMGRVPAVR